MNEIIRILIHRDGMTKKEAEQLYNETKQEILEAIAGGRGFDVEDILACNLGLEPDYIFDMLLF